MALPTAYLNEITSRRNPRIFAWLEIEGLEWGLSSFDLGSQSETFSSRWGTSSLDGPRGVECRLLGPPTPFEVAVDPKEAVATVGQTEVETHDTAGGMLVKAMAVQRKDDAIILAAALTASATTVTYQGEASTSAYPTGGGVIYIGGETIRYTAHDTTGKQFTGCTRGLWRSRKYAHLRGSTITPYPRTLRNRRVWVYFARKPETGATSSDDALRFRGLITDYQQTEALGVYRITCEHDLRRLDKEVGAWLVRGKIEGNPNGGFGLVEVGSHTWIQTYRLAPDQWQLLWPSQDPANATTRFPTPYFQKFVGQAADPYPPGGYYDNGKMAIRIGDALDRVGVPKDPGSGELQRVLYGRTVSSNQGSDNKGHPTEDVDFHEVWRIPAWPYYRKPNQNRISGAYKSTNPIDIMVAHLVSDGTPNTVEEDDGTTEWFKWFGLDGSGHGLNDGWVGLKYSGSDVEIDVASFRAIRDAFLPGRMVRLSAEFDAPFVLRDFLTRNCLKPYGLFLTFTPDMQLKVKRLAVPNGIDGSILALFDSSKVLPDPPPRWEANARQAYAGLRIRSSWLARQADHENLPEEQRGLVGFDYFTDNAFTYGSEAEWIEIETDNQAFDPRSEFTRAIWGLYQIRYAFPAARITLSTHWHDCHDVEVGDPVRVTLPNIPDIETGALGMTDRICYVVGKRMDDFNSRIEWTLEVGLGQARRYCRVSPAGKVKLLVTTTEIELEPNFYTVAPDQDIKHFRVGDKIDGRTLDLKYSRGKFTIATINVATNKITVSPAMTSPFPEVFVFDTYAECVSGANKLEQLRYGFLADSTEDLAPGASVENDRDPYRLL